MCVGGFVGYFVGGSDSCFVGNVVGCIAGGSYDWLDGGLLGGFVVGDACRLVISESNVGVFIVPIG